MGPGQVGLALLKCEQPTQAAHMRRDQGQAGVNGMELIAQKIKRDVVAAERVDRAGGRVFVICHGRWHVAELGQRRARATVDAQFGQARVLLGSGRDQHGIQAQRVGSQQQGMGVGRQILGRQVSGDAAQDRGRRRVEVGNLQGQQKLLQRAAVALGRAALLRPLLERGNGQRRNGKFARRKAAKDRLQMGRSAPDQRQAVVGVKQKFDSWLVGHGRGS